MKNLSFNTNTVTTTSHLRNYREITILKVMKLELNMNYTLHLHPTY